MSLTPFQRVVCHLLADDRIRRGESYVAGGAALNEAVMGSRISHDVDVFHDSAEALTRSWETDTHTLLSHGFEVVPIRQLPTFIEASIRKDGDVVVFQWVQDSAFRFFPLQTHSDFGLVLHPLDLATNKVLALSGRVVIRDWVDTVRCHEKIQPFGCLVWAAAGKNIGINPEFIIEEAARTAHYSAFDLEKLDFSGEKVDFSALHTQWRGMLAEAKQVVKMLPSHAVGMCVCTSKGIPFRGSVDDLHVALDAGKIMFHPGALGGILPQML